jgi:sugar phosphate isomerase/epimerase
MDFITPTAILIAITALLAPTAAPVTGPTIKVQAPAPIVVIDFASKLAIHNHGPEDALYPAPSDVYNRIKNLDARMGMCIDIGHSLRAGTLPEKAIKMYKDRLFDIHIKDINSATKDGKGIEIGRGVININAVIESLKKINYTGYCSIEFEKDMTDTLPGIAESIGYFKGVMNSED